MKWLVLLKEYTLFRRRARGIVRKSLKICFSWEGRAQPRPDLPFLRAGAAWEKRGRAVRSQARPSFFASWRSMGETGEGRAQPRPDLPLLRAGAAWEKRGRAVRSQGPTFLFCELAQHGRNGGGPCAAKARPSSLRAGAAWENEGRAVRSQARPSFFASWRSMGETGEGRAQPRPDLPLLRAGAAWEKRGRAVRSQGPTFLFCELAQHGRNGGGPCAAKARPSSLRAGAAWENEGRAVRSQARPSFFASWRSLLAKTKALATIRPLLPPQNLLFFGKAPQAVSKACPMTDGVLSDVRHPEQPHGPCRLSRLLHSEPSSHLFRGSLSHGGFAPDKPCIEQLLYGSRE